jgi:hypothetical protein
MSDTAPKKPSAMSAGFKTVLYTVLFGTVVPLGLLAVAAMVQSVFGG